MRRIGLALGCGLLVVTLMLGCRTREPNLKPAPEPPVLVVPPDEPQYNQPHIPKEAMKNRFNPYQQTNNPQGTPGGFGQMGGFGGPGLPGGPSRPY